MSINGTTSSAQSRPLFSGLAAEPPSLSQHIATLRAHINSGYYLSDAHIHSMSTPPISQVLARQLPTPVIPAFAPMPPLPSMPPAPAMPTLSPMISPATMPKPALLPLPIAQLLPPLSAADILRQIPPPPAIPTANLHFPPPPQIPAPPAIPTCDLTMPPPPVMPTFVPPPLPSFHPGQGSAAVPLSSRAQPLHLRPDLHGAPSLLERVGGFMQKYDISLFLIGCIAIPLITWVGLYYFGAAAAKGAIGGLLGGFSLSMLLYQGYSSREQYQKLYHPQTGLLTEMATAKGPLTSATTETHVAISAASESKNYLWLKCLLHDKKEQLQQQNFRGHTPLQFAEHMSKQDPVILEMLHQAWKDLPIVRDGSEKKIPE